VIFDVYQLDDDPRPFPEMAGVQDHLVEAAMADNPPSGTFYDPDHPSATERLQSLGVYEHWNDSVNRQYSRNLGTGNGIELIFINGAASRIRPAGPSGPVRRDYSLRFLPSSGTIALFVPENRSLRLSIFDSRGRLLGNALDGYVAAGNYLVEVSNRNRKLPPGFYIIALHTTGGESRMPAATCTAVLTGR
jgi:hypothetical protein